MFVFWPFRNKDRILSKEVDVSINYNKALKACNTFKKVKDGEWTPHYSDCSNELGITQIQVINQLPESG